MNDAVRPFRAAKATAIGSRESNQDRCFFLDDGTSVLLGVADGLGGHPRGEVAAQLFADVCETRFRQTPRPLVDPESFMLECIGRAHQAIRRFGSRQDPPIAPRTTAVLAIIQDGIAHWAHVGDSRLYLSRDNRLTLQTRDHALVRYVRQSADLPPRPRTSLTRCLGGLPQPPTTTCGAPTPLHEGDALLLCTDGLWSQVPEQRLAGLLASSPDSLETALPALTEEAAQTPGSDNVTAIALAWTQAAVAMPAELHDATMRDLSPPFEQLPDPKE
jgi:serine/threonine protein phosphatase PrpC